MVMIGNLVLIIIEWFVSKEFLKNDIVKIFYVYY